MKKVYSVVLGLAFATVSAYAAACPLASLGSVSSCALTAGANAPGGSINIFNTSINFSAAGGGNSYAGVFTENVLKNDPNNPWGMGAETFVYTITVNSAVSANGGIEGIQHFTPGGFGGVLTSVGYLVSGSNDPTSINRQAGSGTIVDFSFIPGQIAAGQTETVVVYTNATFLGVNSAGLNDDVATTVTPLLGPSLVPEPTSMSLIGGGLALLGLLRFRRKA
jgi:PEP-CTERM motif